MEHKFWKIVNDVVSKADIVLEVLDARMIPETRNEEVENKVRAAGKQLIYVVNKCDLVDKHKLEREIRNLKMQPTVFVSAVMHYGTTMLRDKILRFAKQKEVLVGVVGYPNTGKSSVINALKGKQAAKVSPQSGFTKAVQLIKADNRIKLLDTPGVIPYGEKDARKHNKTSTTDFSKIKDPEMAAMDLISDLGGAVEDHYGVLENEDKEETLKDIAIKRNLLQKKAQPNTQLAARIILREWQTGKIRKK